MWFGSLMKSYFSDLLIRLSFVLVNSYLNPVISSWLSDKACIFKESSKSIRFQVSIVFPMIIISLLPPLTVTGFFRKLYESTRLPFTPPYGGLPVKFRTYIGEPIPYDPNITTDELVEKVSWFYLQYWTTHFVLYYICTWNHFLYPWKKTSTLLLASWSNR